MSDPEFDDVCLDDEACSAVWDEVEQEQARTAAQERKERARASAFRKRRYAFCAPERREALEAQDAAAAKKKRVAREAQRKVDAAEAAKRRELAAKRREQTTLPCFPDTDGDGWADFYIRVAGIICRRLKDAKPGLALLAWTTDTHFVSLRVFADYPAMDGYFSETWSVEDQRVTNVVHFRDMWRTQRDSLNDIFGRIVSHFNWAQDPLDQPEAPKQGNPPDQPQCEDKDEAPRSKPVFASISQRVVRNAFARCEVNEISFR